MLTRPTCDLSYEIRITLKKITKIKANNLMLNDEIKKK
jgi:hypothetical protein